MITFTQCRSVLTASLLAAAAVVLTVAPTARADVVTVSVDNLRSGWDQNEAGLSPANVASSDFGQLFAAQLDGQVYAQPIVAKQTVMAVTENDKVYGLNPVTGAIKWSRDVGPYWPASAIGCGDLVPNIGITSTPAYDAATGTAYFMSKVNDGADTNHPHWYLHAVDITTGAERPNFPTTIQGAPANDPTRPFNPKTAAQRPGLLLMNGVVYAGFASYCDYGPYVGYIVGVNGTSGKLTTMWSDEAGSSSSEAGIWQSGGGLVSDGSGQILFTTGNGVSPAPGPGNRPPSTLAESVVRIAVDGSGTVTPKDFFSPVNNSQLDRDDADLGSGGPMAIPDGYGTAAHPHLLVQPGKDGRVFLLDRDNLGGTGQGANGTDGVLQVLGPFKGVWGHSAFWGGNGGYVYLVTNNGPMLAFKVGVAGNGLPALTQVGASTGNWGFGSGSPVVTSSGTTAGSALVWNVYSTGGAGTNGELRAYNAVPANGVLAQRFAAPLGTTTKFSVPATDGGRVYVGTRDGKLFGFGRPASSSLNGSPTDFGSVAVGTTSTKTVTVTASVNLTVSAVSTTAPFSTGQVSLPQTLNAGQSLSVPITFSPTTAGSQSAPLSFTTSAGNYAFDLRGAATQPGLSATPSSLDFGQVPTGGKIAKSVDIVNTGSSTTTITSATGPTDPFSSSSLPAAGQTLAPGASLSVPVTYAPTQAGTFSSTLQVNSSSGNVTVPVTGTSIVGAPKLSITPTSVDFGSVATGQSATRTFQIANTGNTVLTITKAAPPTAPFLTPSPVSEGQQLEPGASLTQSVTFAPTAAGSFSGNYSITGNDGQGAILVAVRGQATTGGQSLHVPGPSSGRWQLNGSATQSGDVTTLTTATANQVGNAVYGTPVATNGLQADYTVSMNGGSGADGIVFALLDPAKNTATSTGQNGQSLGFGPLAGAGVGLDTYKHQNDPSNNYVGISGGGTVQPVWVATQNLPTSLRTGTHAVHVSVGVNQVSVTVDGGTPLTASVAVPAKALLAFTGSTGSVTDIHRVSGVSIRVPAPVTGPVVGLAAKCLDDMKFGTADGNPIQLFTCLGNGAQQWTLPGDQTLRIFGKCLSVSGGATANYTPVVLNTCQPVGANGAQTWVAQANTTLRNPASGRCLDVTGANSADRTRLIIWDCTGNANQLWKLPGGIDSTS